MFLNTMFTFKNSPGFFVPFYRRPYYSHATKLLAQNIQEVEMNDIETAEESFIFKDFRFKHFLHLGHLLVPARNLLHLHDMWATLRLFDPDDVLPGILESLTVAVRGERREHLRLFEWLSELLDQMYTQANAFPNLSMVLFVFQIRMEAFQCISINDERDCWEKGLNVAYVGAVDKVRAMEELHEASISGHVFFAKSPTIRIRGITKEDFKIHVTRNGQRLGYRPFTWDQIVNPSCSAAPEEEDDPEL
jgi:hypothetical protein